MGLLKQAKEEKRIQKEDFQKPKRETDYYESLLSKEQKQLTGMEKFKEALKICEIQMQKEEEKECQQLGEKAYHKKKKQEMKEFLKEEKKQDLLEKKLFLRKKLENYCYQFFNMRPKKVAVMFCSIVAAFLMIGTTGIALRSPLADFATEIFDKSSLLKMNDFYYENKNEPQIVDTFYSPTYIPDGYELETVENNNGFHHMLYKNKEGKEIIIYQNFIKIYNEIDTETTNYKTVEWNGIKYYYLDDSIKNSKKIIITWFDSQYQFQIYGHLPVDELLQIADSMEKTDKLPE